MKALYYQELDRPVQLHVLKEHKDGTVDLGTDEETLTVGKCPLADAPTHGHAVLIKEKAGDGGKTAAEKKAAAEKAAADKAAAAEMAAADKAPAEKKTAAEKAAAEKAAAK